MEKQLKLKSSPILILLRIIAVLLTLLSVALILLSYVDLRTEDQKLADKRAEIMSMTGFSSAKKAVIYVNSKYVGVQITKVRYLISTQKYVLVEFTSISTNITEITYSAKNEKGYNGDNLYQQAKSSLITDDLFLGNKNKNHEVIFNGETLHVLLEEAGLWHL